MKILLIEDDSHLSQTIEEQLSNHFIVEILPSGEEGEFAAQINTYDLIILDYLLPDTTGLEVCKRLRKEKIHTPILMLTGLNTIEKKVMALDSGVDDYITKPFNIHELSARIRALLRRHSTIIKTNTLQAGDLILDRDKRMVKRNNMFIQLKRQEFFILEYLMKHVGKVITREMILDNAWHSVADVMGNVVDVHIKYLRDRIDKPFSKKLIKTIHGFGYKLEI